MCLHWETLGRKLIRPPRNLVIFTEIFINDQSVRSKRVIQVTKSNMEGSASEYKSSEDEGKMENIAQNSLQTSKETKVCQINP